jgi:hypothetical protein
MLEVIEVLKGVRCVLGAVLEAEKDVRHVL